MYQKDILDHLKSLECNTSPYSSHYQLTALFESLHNDNLSVFDFFIYCVFIVGFLKTTSDDKNFILIFIKRAIHFCRPHLECYNFLLVCCVRVRSHRNAELFQSSHGEKSCFFQCLASLRTPIQNVLG